MDNKLFYEEVEGFLNPLGFTLLEIAYPGTIPLQEVVNTIKIMNDNVYYMLGGTSQTGCGHIVIYCGNELAWDPSPVDANVIAPMEDGNYWITFLLPLSMRQGCRKYTSQVQSADSLSEKQPTGDN